MFSISDFLTADQKKELDISETEPRHQFYDHRIDYDDAPRRRPVRRPHVSREEEQMRHREFVMMNLKSSYSRSHPYNTVYPISKRQIKEIDFTKSVGCTTINGDAGLVSVYKKDDAVFVTFHPMRNGMLGCDYVTEMGYVFLKFTSDGSFCQDVLTEYPTSGNYNIFGTDKSKPNSRFHFLKCASPDLREEVTCYTPWVLSWNLAFGL